jgi:hypothetical protein
VAQELSAAVVTSPCLRGRGGVADAACGNDTGFVDGVAGLGRWDGAAGPHTTRVWRARPATHVPPWRGRGRRPPRERGGAGAPAVRPVREGAAALPVAAWSRQTSKAGRPGPMGAALAALRVLAGRDAGPGPDVWWVRRRHLETGALQTDRCPAPRDTAVATPVRRSGRPWPLATWCEDRTPRLGRGD